MTAQEANNLAKIVKETQESNIVYEILDLIKHSAKLGNFETYYYQRLPSNIQEYFKSLGYTIISGMDRNEYFHHIKW